MAEENTIVSGLSDTVAIKTCDAPNEPHNWVLRDNVLGEEIPITPNEVPEMVAMLEAFRNHCIEDEDCFVEPPTSSSSA